MLHYLINDLQCNFILYIAFCYNNVVVKEPCVLLFSLHRRNLLLNLYNSLYNSLYNFAKSIYSNLGLSNLNHYHDAIYNANKIAIHDFLTCFNYFYHRFFLF